MYYPELSSLMSENPYIPATLFNRLDEFFASLTRIEHDKITAQFVAYAVGTSSAVSEVLLQQCLGKGLLGKGVQIICPETGDQLEVYWANEELPKSIDCGSCEISHRIDECKIEGVYKLKRILATVPRNEDVTAITVVLNLLNRFHKLANQLKSRYKGRPTLVVEDEYDVQDLLHALLWLYFQDIRPEEWTPSYAGGSARMDFLLKREKIVLEVKKTRDGLGVKDVGDQLLIDIGRYHAHPDCRHLICFVYDPEVRIANPRGLESDLSKDIDGMRVTVLVAPA